MSDAINKSFDLAWDEALRRYKISIAVKEIDLVIKNDKGEPIPPHGLKKIVDRWLKIEAFYDRRVFLFETIFEMTGGLKLGWRGAGYLNAIRRADMAYTLLKKFPLPVLGEEDYFDHCALYARTCLNLTRYEEAMEWAEKLQLSPNLSVRKKTLVADVLHTCGYEETAHNIYSRLMSNAPPDPPEEENSISLMFSKLFNLEIGVIPSPIMASSMASTLTNSTQAKEFWSLAEEEFYDSPHFRTSYSQYLAEQGDMMESFTKLLVLVKEMPWLRAASLSLESYFSGIDPSGKEIMPDFQRKLREKIKNEGWTREGLTNITINPQKRK